jgi:hypothetical protein
MRSRILQRILIPRTISLTQVMSLATMQRKDKMKDGVTQSGTSVIRIASGEKGVVTGITKRDTPSMSKETESWYMMVKGESRNSRTRGVILKRE